MAEERAVGGEMHAWDGIRHTRGETTGQHQSPIPKAVQLGCLVKLQALDDEDDDDDVKQTSST
jgi:hypothetical protein